MPTPAGSRRAIDVHVHPPTKEYLVDSGEGYLKNAFQILERQKTIDEMVEEFRAAGVERAVLLAWDARPATKRPPTSNEYVKGLVDAHDGFFLGFGSVDPWRTEEALKELERFPEEFGFPGLKLHPSAQAFHPNDRRFYPLWERCEELGLIVLFHVGHTGFGAGLPGGAGIRLEYSRPIPYIEDVAVDFPDLQILCAHPGWPWHDELLALALHKSNIWIDLSGWSPKYLPPSVVQHANSLLQDKMLFGTDYPVISPERWMSDLDELGLKPEVVEKILRTNAMRLLKLENDDRADAAQGG
jgi:predicted TIM-barrel fold metal-dependent hydrolase